MSDKHLFRLAFRKRNRNNEENRILNTYLTLGWSVIAAVLTVSYALEVVKGAFTLQYYFVFLIFTLVPLFFCVLKFKKTPHSFNLRYFILIGYFLMYGFVLLTGHTGLVFTFIFPLLSLVILYHDPAIILQMGIVALGLNIIVIIRDSSAGKITLINSRDYEIQIALIVLCFGGCLLASVVYEKLSKVNQEKEREVLRLKEEQIILQERNKYAVIDAMTGAWNRRKYEEDIE
ncbi:MAG: hypothetical protein HUJ73_03850, partial [Eubacterium sp.]|nr:hypothetical protein [Eubacterium sp.]